MKPMAIILFLVCSLSSCISRGPKSMPEEVSAGNESDEFDAFRWMEEDSERLKSELERLNEEAVSYLEFEKKSRSIVERLMSGLRKDRSPSIMRVRGSKVFFLSSADGSDVKSIKVLDLTTGNVLTIIDPSRVQPNQTFAINDFDVSKDGRYIAYTAATKGKEVGSIRMYDPTLFMTDARKKGNAPA